MFVPNIPIAEMVLRGSIVYLALFIMIRVVRKRQSSQVGLTDLLVLVLIADAAQNAMSSDYVSITDGLVLVATIILWSYLLDWLGYMFPRVGRFIHPRPLPIVEKGRMLRQNMRREQITEEELMTQLREQGVEDVSEVKAAYMEGDGQVSVIKKRGSDAQRRKTPTY
jgi:uncharacterized membrane protein YcaP (DUF421 family)